MHKHTHPDAKAYIMYMYLYIDTFSRIHFNIHVHIHVHMHMFIHISIHDPTLMVRHLDPLRLSTGASVIKAAFSVALSNIFSSLAILGAPDIRQYHPVQDGVPIS